MLLINSIYFTAVRYISKVTRAGLKLTNNKDITTMKLNKTGSNKPSSAYVLATWGALVISVTHN